MYMHMSAVTSHHPWQRYLTVHVNIVGEIITGRILDRYNDKKQQPETIQSCSISPNQMGFTAANEMVNPYYRRAT